VATSEPYVDGFDEGVASWEVAIERAGADVGSACDVVEALGCAIACDSIRLEILGIATRIR
jgi:hypothetical protein